MDAKTRKLVREARRLLAAYTGSTTVVEAMGISVAVSMARASFAAHSIQAGYDRTTVNQVQAYIFG